ncbi:hypothetical protein D2Q93_10915 [Alicyclobacillaceae bacterium I2511]|nr:hypothetical protein D2Q93_10915 [Alicyclobacillaceae bacterium I2511]
MVLQGLDTVKKYRQIPQQRSNQWKTLAVYSGATLQLGTSVVVFALLGHGLALRWHAPWVTAAGALVGVVVGGTGLVFLAKQILGDRQ